LRNRARLVETVSSHWRAWERNLKFSNGGRAKRNGKGVEYAAGSALVGFRKGPKAGPELRGWANKCSAGQCPGRAKGLSLHKFYVNTGHNKTNGSSNGDGEGAAAA